MARMETTWAIQGHFPPVCRIAVECCVEAEVSFSGAATKHASIELLLHPVIVPFLMNTKHLLSCVPSLTGPFRNSLGLEKV